MKHEIMNYELINVCLKLIKRLTNNKLIFCDSKTFGNQGSLFFILERLSNGSQFVHFKFEAGRYIHATSCC